MPTERRSDVRPKGAHLGTLLRVIRQRCNKRWPCPTTRARDLLERLSQQVASRAEATSAGKALDGAGTASRSVPDAPLSPDIRERILAGARRHGASVPTITGVGLAAVVGALAAHPDGIGLNHPGFGGGSGYWIPTGDRSACWAA